MVLTKQDLIEWKNNPVTVDLMKVLSEQVSHRETESCLMDTCDKTAMKASYNEGLVDGMNMILETYDEMETDANE